MATLAITPVFGTTTHRHSSTTHLRTASKKGRKNAHVIRGQRAIDSDRASQIQNALIKQKYMTGAPSGQWDAQTQAAMQQYHSRALISLGLGPNHTSTVATHPAEQAENTAQASEPAAANTLASVHSLSQ
jgi:hypothetical protein